MRWYSVRVEFFRFSARSVPSSAFALTADEHYGSESPA
jgi:hypothetical protein